MNKERKGDWPVMENMEGISGNWWKKVMKATAPYNDFFDESLSDNEDFTIRTMTYIMMKTDEETIDEYLGESLHVDRVKIINSMLTSEDDVQIIEGIREMRNFVEEFNEDMRLED